MYDRIVLEEMTLYSLMLNRRSFAAGLASDIALRAPADGAVRDLVPQRSAVDCAFVSRSPNLMRSRSAAPAKPSPTPQEATKILKALGSRVRNKSSTYIDASVLLDPGADVIVRGGRNEYFPEKVYIMLEETEKAGQQQIVSWCSHGRAWKIENQDRFVKEIMPVYFSGLSKYTRYVRLHDVAESPDGTTKPVLTTIPCNAIHLAAFEGS
jgi:hypothetical protein